MSETPTPVYASRSAHKLVAALDHFKIAPADRVCADLGSNVGGFVDVLLRRGARRVFAVDTGYGVLAYRLRTDARVTVMERTNAMHVELPEAVDLVTIDVAWTPQRRILPAARRLLKPGGCIITLIKPHYEADRRQLQRGVLRPEETTAVVEGVVAEMAGMGLTCCGVIASPLAGHQGNVEYLALVRPQA